MKRIASIIVSFACLWLDAVAAYGQSGAAPYAGQFAAEVVDPSPEAAAPAADPVLPAWGNYSAPPRVPEALPAVEYDLAGPPRGVFQRLFEYRRVVGDPASLPALDAGLTQGIDLLRPDGVAPIGVRGDHTLKVGQVFFSVRHDQESYDGLFVGSHRVSADSVLASYPFAPRRLFQNTETVLLEYGATEDFTMQMLLPFEHSRLDYLTASPPGGSYTTAFGNPGDVKLTALYVLYRRPGQQLHLNLGLNIPVGFLDYLTVRPSPAFPNLPYVIRTSSGSYDLLPGLTYRGQNDRWTWGAQASADIHLGVNRLDYEVGDQVDLTAWLARRWTERWATSARIDGQGWGNVRQADPRLNTALSPTNRPDLQGGMRVNVLFGVNYYWPKNHLPDQIFSVEAGVPVFQSLDGPQLGLDWTLIAGWNLIL